MADYGDFLQAFQVGANVQNMAWQRQERMQQLRAQEALLRIKERMETYEVQELVARRDKYFEDAMTTQADRIRKAAALKAAADMFPAKLQASGGDPMKALGDMVAPVSAMDPEVGAQLAQGYQRGMAGQMEGKARPLDPSAAAANQARADYYKARATAAGKTEEGFTPDIVLAKNPKTGQDVPVLRTGPRSAQLLGGKEDEIRETYDLMKSAEGSGDEELVALYRGKLAKLSQPAKQTGMTLETNTDGTFRLVQGPMEDAGALTKPNLTKVQESQAQALSTIEIGNRLLPLLDSDTVGVKAFAESWVKDRMLAQAFPELASNKRATAEELAANIRASVIKTLRSDSNISEPERRQILRSVPDINSPIDSPARAKIAVKASMKTAAIHAMVAAHRMNGKIPQAAALGVDDETILALSDQGLISVEQMFEAKRIKEEAKQKK